MCLSLVQALAPPDLGVRGRREPGSASWDEVKDQEIRLIVEGMHVPGGQAMDQFLHPGQLDRAFFLSVGGCEHFGDGSPGLLD